ncbi:hypothetical protein LPJ61_001556 [Coemansia biformis]|uniref:Cation/H+ exchanger transmembrane domain-containing protein n=1 Tax=Coemansia biformis TaxID=1286918 RepID=A0A9W8CX67_9FUNG|nr:hypothetical protein LPJ61_001556 [Coemansia biformis]
MGVETKVVPAFLGGFICIYGLVSGFVKERLFLSEALVAMVFGIVVGPRVIDVVDPRSFVNVHSFTREFARYVIAIQVMAAGITLPGRYMVRKWRTMSVLLGPVMIVMWLVTAGIIHLMFKLSFKQSLLIASCAAPTDPILANSVVKGRYAEANVPKNVRDALSAESGVNDGLGLPFLYFALYLLDESYTTRHAIGKWFYWTWCYNILLSTVIGIVVGYIARKLLRLSESYDLIDKESFLSFSIGLAVFIVGCLQLIGSDDILCCFIAGHSFTWDDWFRDETKDAHFQEVLDGLINVTFFIYFGTIIPWDQFTNAELVLAPWRLIVAAILVLLLRRLPVVLLLTRFTPAFRNFRQSLFAGWFGPIGVGAIFFAEIVLEEIEKDPDSFHLRSREIIEPIIMFLIFSSVLVHGTTLPLMYIGKVVRTRSRSMSTMSIRNGIASRLSFIYSRDHPDTSNLHVSVLDGTLNDEYVDEALEKRDGRVLGGMHVGSSAGPSTTHDGSQPGTSGGSQQDTSVGHQSQPDPERLASTQRRGSLDLTRTITIDDTPKVARDQMDIHYHINQARGQFRQHVQNLNTPTNAHGPGYPYLRPEPAMRRRSYSVRDIPRTMQPDETGDDRHRSRQPLSAEEAGDAAGRAATRAKQAADLATLDAAVSYPEPVHVSRKYTGASETRSDTDLAALRGGLDQQQRRQQHGRRPGEDGLARPSSAGSSQSAPHISVDDEEGLVLAADEEIASRHASRAATRQTAASDPNALPDSDMAHAIGEAAPATRHSSLQGSNRHATQPAPEMQPGTEQQPDHQAVDIGQAHHGAHHVRRRSRDSGIRRIIRRRRRTPQEGAAPADSRACEFIGNRRNPLGRREDGELVDYDDPNDNDLETGFMEHNVDDRLADYFTLDLGTSISRLRSWLSALRHRQTDGGRRD